jgi:hypothetical protein
VFFCVTAVVVLCLNTIQASKFEDAASAGTGIGSGNWGGGTSSTAMSSSSSSSEAAATASSAGQRGAAARGPTGTAAASTPYQIMQQQIENSSLLAKRQHSGALDQFYKV